MRKVFLILLIAVAINARSQEKIITTIAGNGTPGFSGDNGPATSAQIEGGLGLYVDPNNNIYISAGTRIRKVTAATGIITTIAGTGVHGYSGDNGPAIAAQLNIPYGVYADAAGNVYICTPGDSRVRKINTSGIITTFAGNGTSGYTGDGGLATAAQLNLPGNITGDAAGNIYISDYGNMTIRKVNTSGIISTIAGNGGFGYTGNGGNALAATLASPNSVSFDAAGNFYIGEDNPNGVRKVNLSNIISALAGNGNASTGSSGDGGIATAALFCGIGTAVTDPAGNVYIADGCNFKIRKVDAVTGFISAYAGTGFSGFNGDGPATAVSMNPRQTHYINNTLYFTDNGNSRIRKISDVYTFNGNGDWDIASNWVNNQIAPKNIPVGTTVVINHINGGQCIVTGNINIQQFAQLTINGLKTLTINNGDLTNAGLITGGGYLSMSGSLTGFSSTGLVQDTMLLINKQLFLTGTTNVNLMLLNGNSKIRLDNFNLNANELYGGSNSYVITNGTGSLSLPVSGTPVQFPIGSSTSNYAPATLINAGTSDRYGVRVGTGVLTANRQLVPQPITTGNVNQSWFVQEETAGGSNVTLSFQWNGSDEQAGFNRNNAYISHMQVCPPPVNCDVGFYDASARSAATGTDPYEITRPNVTSFNTPTFIVTSDDVVFRFVGNGNWNNPLNWTNEIIPPTTITTGMHIIINPASGQCDFSGTLTIQPGGKLTVATGKIFNVTGNIINQ